MHCPSTNELAMRRGGPYYLMVDGDLFLGDVLLLEGEYQLAPRGTSHSELVSEHGCIVFFHGSIDPVLEDAAWCQEMHRTAV